jgi:class 3 adenylate cyclase
MGLLLAILVPAAGLIGYLFAGWFSRSIPPLVEAAKAVALGERKPVVPSSGGGELTDLGERLELVARELEQQEQQLEEEYESRRDLLLSVLPSRLVNHEGEVGDEVDAVRRATAISIDLELAGRSAGSDPPAAALAGSLRDDVITAGAELGIEPVRLAADRSLFITGAASESVEADNALRFAAIVSAKIHALDHEHGDGYAVRVGLASGTVATGVLEAGALTFAAWGNPVRRALAIGALARPDEIMVDYTTVAELSSDEFDLEPATNVISLDGQPMDVKRFRPREPSASSGVEPPTSNQDEPDPSPSDGAVR